MPQDEFGKIDEKTVETIVNKMKKKYLEEGAEFEAVEGQLGELRGIVSAEKQNYLKLQSIEELADSSSPWIRRLGKFYLKLRNPLKPLGKLIANLPQAKTLNFYLYSANMNYSLRQYLALTTSVTVICFVAGFLIGLVSSFLIRVSVIGTFIFMFLGAFLLALFGAFIMLFYPRNKASQRGQQATSELPFALRHMAAELKAGIGLFRTVQIIASADYGVLSEEFARTTSEIDEGTDAKDALRNMAFRVQSLGLRNAVMHVVRAMKTGGNLSDVMNEIAEDIADEQRNQIREFAEKMNFFGIIFIFSAIVLPSMAVTLGGIRAAPLPLQIQIPITPAILAALFFGIMPMLMFILIVYLRSIQPN